jgi:hypothetical protein
MNNFPNEFHEAVQQAAKPQPNHQAPLDQKFTRPLR